MDFGADNVLDFLDRAIGNLERDRRASFLRTLNPLYWLGRFLELLGEFPFVVLGRLGFDRTRLETSFGGRLMKVLFQLVGLVGSIFTITEFVRQGDRVRQFLGLAP